MNLDDYDWFCDECDAYLNDQPGFDASSGSWTCTECGNLNYIDESEIISEEEYDEYQNSGSDSYNDYVEERDSSEALSVDDAALIWLSNGRDEDYTFGYSEEELEEALKD